MINEMGFFLHDEYGTKRRSSQHRQQYGSFCLRLGAIGFGAGSLVFTGLQIGAEIASAVPFRAITPSARLLLVTAQMHFIFLNSKDLELTKHGPLAKLGLMHMIATNICEWLQALVEETRHEISHLESKPNTNDGLLRNLLRDASPFLFPCTIEFSLICAVILFEMWKRVDRLSVTKSNSPTRSVHHLSIDCSNAHRGLFGGILIIAATVLSLIMFFVLKDAKPKMAIQQVTALETTILIAGAIAAVSGALKLRRLEWKKTKLPHLDSTLLAAAQAGVYLHCMFGAVGGVLTMGPTWGLSLAADFIALVQSTSQTLLIKIAWRRQSSSNAKPGKELITFLIVMNIALWIVNSFEKSRAAVRPEHLEFFGVWAWTIITHVSMPLAIFFRFHSAICLFEVWKSCYKYRPPNFFHQFRSPNEKT
uniref:Otop3_1 protein n=1 Tax=Fopius arisanus TaxID=64838 RepID=A0A0C9RT05_9HYME